MKRAIKSENTHPKCAARDKIDSERAGKRKTGADNYGISITTKAEAIAFLQKAGIFDETGTLAKAYR